MSSTKLRNHGLYDKDIPDLLSLNTNFAGFQCWELMSELVATPASPNAPALESGEIDKNGTAELTTRAPVVDWPNEKFIVAIITNNTVRIRFMIKMF